MPKYSFKAKDTQGRAIIGQIESASLSGVSNTLKQRQLLPININEVVEEQDVMASPIFMRAVSMTEVIMFCRQMYSLTKAGIPLIPAIKGLSASTSSPKLRLTLNDLSAELEKGRSLSAAMSSHPEVFNSLMVSIVNVGENTGRLDYAFLQLSEYFEQDEETRKQIKQATRYPMFVLIALVLAMVVLNFFVIPEFANMFASMGAELPWATKALMASSEFFLTYWWIVLLVVIGLVFGIRQYTSTERGHERWGRVKLKLPIIGEILNRATMGRFARSFSLMLEAGVPLTTALGLVADVVDNGYLSKAVRKIRQRIESGESLTRASAQSGIFTPLTMQMITVGEETGQIDEMLKEVSSFYEREVAHDLKTLTSKIEPILIAIVAGMVLILALGIFTPMWDMMGAYE